MKKSLTIEEKQRVINLKREGLSSRQICDVLGWARTRKSTINDFLALPEASCMGFSKSLGKTGAKILILDIEKTHNVSCHWKQWDENLPDVCKLRESHILSYSAMWVSDQKVFGNILSAQKIKQDFIRNIEHDDATTSIDHNLVKELWTLLDDADVVVAYNGKGYDVKEINASFLKFGMTPPSPYKVIDPLQSAKKLFRLPFKNLDYVAKYLNVTRKVQNSGHSLWKACLLGDEKAIETMAHYNDGDIITLYEVWLKLREWDNNGVNLSLYSDTGSSCPHCSGTNVIAVPNKYVYLASSKYALFKCTNCGANLRGTKNVLDKKDTFKRI